jgi:hypothetical protein
MPTKPDKSRPAPRFKPLSPAQETALTLYLAGRSDADVAEAVGVTRQTCNEWRNQHVVFMVELEKRRADLPETVMPFIHQVYDGFRLLLGLKWTHTAGEPTAFSRRFAAAWCGVTERQMTMSMQYLLGQRYLVKAPRFAGKGRTYATFAVGEGPNPGA